MRLFSSAFWTTTILGLVALFPESRNALRQQPQERSYTPLRPSTYWKAPF